MAKEHEASLSLQGIIVVLLKLTGLPFLWVLSGPMRQGKTQRDDFTQPEEGARLVLQAACFSGRQSYWLFV